MPSEPAVVDAGLRSRALRGAIWSLLGNGSGDALRLVGNLILTRLLFPEAFGLMALVNLVITGLQTFSNVGIRAALVRHERGEDPDFVGAAFVIQIARGLLLSAIAAGLAWPIAGIYDEPQLAVLLLAAAVVPLIDGLASPRIPLLARQIDVHRRVRLELIAKAVALVAMVGIGWYTESVWALLAGNLAFSLTRTLLSHQLPGMRTPLCFEREAMREILSFGSWILVSTGLAYLARRIDVLLLGLWLGTGELGVYSVAILLVSAPQRVLSGVSQGVIMPVLAEAQRTSLARFNRVFGELRGLIFPAIALILSFGIAVAPVFVGILYDERYAAAGWMAQFALLALWFELVHQVDSRALLALGDSRTLAVSNLIRTALAAAGAWAGYQMYGIPGLLVGIAFASAVASAFVCLALNRAGVRSGLQELAATALLLAAVSFVMLAAERLTQSLALPSVELVALALAVTVCGVPAALVLRRLNVARRG